MGAIWIGAFIFFRVAIPDAVGALLADEAGNLLTAQNGDFLAAEPNAFQIAAHNRYLWWGDLAMAFVTIGSIMQVKAQGR
jgi:hypothetical protein